MASSCVSSLDLGYVYGQFKRRRRRCVAVDYQLLALCSVEIIHTTCSYNICAGTTFHTILII